jgi:hypothetical protein
LNDSENSQTKKVQIAGVIGNRIPPPTFTPMNLKVKPPQESQKPTEAAPTVNDLVPSSEFGEDELFLRDFFPEVWLFKDYTFG